LIAGFRPGQARADESPEPPNEDIGPGLESWVGEIVTVPYSFAPRGFVFYEGQKLPVAQNQSLFSLIGTRYGGDGRTTFGLPDTRPLETEAQRTARSSQPPFRYAIALAGTFPARS
jgi:microcystin-dependent protein